MVFLNSSSHCSIRFRTSGLFFAWLTYSQGSFSTSNKQGPASFVQLTGGLGGLVHVTTAFFNAAALEV